MTPLSLSLSLSLVNSHFPGVIILDFIGAIDGGGDDNCKYKTCKAPVKMSPLTPVFLQARCPSCHPTNSVKGLKGK